eukprot:588377-Pelagomonas_calceolata.AAC.5
MGLLMCRWVLLQLGTAKQLAWVLEQELEWRGQSIVFDGAYGEGTVDVPLGLASARNSKADGAGDSNKLD